ncbi:50S ribosomal protein L2 [bacterium]|jgi:large subunit ribosomal protein L2|nr:50S ribosomal protein L2 [bacterium]
MSVKSFRPVTPSRRFMTVKSQDGLSKESPCRSLLAPLHKTGGRNHSGKITSRHRGGGHKRRYRIIDFKRNKYDIPGIVERIEYDPNRTSHIALIKYADGERRYILAPKGLVEGHRVISGNDVELKPGNSLPMKNMPEGSWIHNIEVKPGKGGQLVRSAGTGARLMAVDEKTVVIKLPSSEMRRLPADCFATLGVIGNQEHEGIVIGKAGRSRWLGIRPQTRGMAMNPKDHPHGGGEGRSKSGHHPVSPWGKPCRGYVTRNRKKYSNPMIITKRKRKRK